MKVFKVLLTVRHTLTGAGREYLEKKDVVYESYIGETGENLNQGIVGLTQ